MLKSSITEEVLVLSIARRKLSTYLISEDINIRNNVFNLQFFTVEVV